MSSLQTRASAQRRRAAEGSSLEELGVVLRANTSDLSQSCSEVPGYQPHVILVRRVSGRDQPSLSMIYAAGDEAPSALAQGGEGRGLPSCFRLGVHGSFSLEQAGSHALKDS